MRTEEDGWQGERPHGGGDCFASSFARLALWPLLTTETQCSPESGTRAELQTGSSPASGQAECGAEGWVRFL